MQTFNGCECSHCSSVANAEMLCQGKPPKKLVIALLLTAVGFLALSLKCLVLTRMARAECQIRQIVISCCKYVLKIFLNVRSDNEFSEECKQLQ